VELTKSLDRLPDDLLLFAPELILCVTITALLFARLFRALDRVHLVPLAIFGGLAALGAVLLQFTTFDTTQVGTQVFTGLLYLDTMAAFFRAVILVGTLVVLWLCHSTRLPDKFDSVDFSVLLLGAALGMMLMASANHLLMAFIAVEMASLPSYALAGFLKGKSRGSEAALKYAVYGAASSGLMLYGISLVVPSAGSGAYSQLTHLVAQQVAAGVWDTQVVVGLVLIFVGLGFKLSAVPFHVWLPDAFEGAAAEVAAFLSVVSKAAALALAMRLLQKSLVGGFEVRLPEKIHQGMGFAVLLAAAVTATVGNLLAYGQTNLQRLLAYSTIAHAGYMMMAMGLISLRGYEAIAVYIVAYLFANLGAFAVVAHVRNATGGDQISALNGLITRSPVLGLGLVVFVVSLLGLPPTAGFAGKFLVFSALVDSQQYWVLGVGVVNTVISAGYYLRLLKAAGLDTPLNPETLSIPNSAKVLIALLTLGTVVLGVYWEPLATVSRTAFLSFR
jgi:NADH-quinone oxidoreductase subunit N